MSKINNGGPAFPRPMHVSDEYHDNGADGMSLRAYLASKLDPHDDLEWIAPALMGEEPPKWSAAGDYEQSLVCVKWWATARAKFRLMEADALIAELTKEPTHAD